MKGNSELNLQSGFYLQELGRELSSSLTWIVFSKSIDIRNAGNNFYIPYDCPFLVIEDYSNSTYFLREFYKINDGFRLFEIEYGTWSLENGLNISNKPFYDRRMNFENHPLVLTHIRKVRINCY